MRIVFFVLLVISGYNVWAQITMNEGPKNISLRGLSVVSDKIIWVAGNKGTVGLSKDGAKTFDWIIVPGYEKRDFRDVEGFSENEAIIMAIDTPATILKTIDGGRTWNKTYENSKMGMFLDAMDFLPNNKDGMIVGDAVDGKFFLAKTNDGGTTWKEIVNEPIALENEGCFASSGTNIILYKNKYYFVTGGYNARCFLNNKPLKLDIIQGNTSAGAHSIAISKNGKNIIIVGGDYVKKDQNEKNILVSNNGGKLFFKPKNNPNGHRSCVTFIDLKSVISCGPNGIDISYDKGLTWTALSKEGFHVCAASPSGQKVYFAGSNGKVGIYTYLKK